MDNPHSNSGRWFAISVELWDHPIVGAKKPVTPADPRKGSASRLEAWLWMIRSACFKTHSILNKGRKMTLKRGDLLGSYSYLASEWNWTPKTVRWFIKKLIEDQMLMDVTLDLQRHGISESPKTGQLKGNRKGNSSANSSTPKLPSKRALVSVLSLSNYAQYQHDPRAQMAYEGRQEDGKRQLPQQLPDQIGATEGQLKGNTVQGIHNKKENMRASEGGGVDWNNVFADPHAGVQMHGGRLELVNGTRAYWLEQFDGDQKRLELALHQAAGFVQPNASRPLEAQVSAQLARIAGERVDKNQRYEKSVRASGKGSPSKSENIARYQKAGR